LLIMVLCASEIPPQCATSGYGLDRVR
jgi:hypothetical protein